MRNVTKIFGSFVANNQVNLQVRRGEIHALLGENGAGKSTMMNMLAGLLQPTSGDILLNGEVVQITSPTTANKLGIGMVHQHFMLVDAFTVTENIMLGSEISHLGVLDRKKAKEEIVKISEQYGLQVDPDAYVRDISVGMQQRVEILKTLYRGADVLIFDEPTAVLTPQEIEELIMIMKELINELNLEYANYFDKNEIVTLSMRYLEADAQRFFSKYEKGFNNYLSDLLLEISKEYH